MLILSVVWLGLFVIELIWGLTPILDVIGIAIWIAFVVEFGLEFLLAPHRLNYLKRNWLTAISLLLPALRLLRFGRILRALRTVRSVRGLQLLRVMTRTNQGMQALASSFNRRGFGYVVGLTAIVIPVGAAGMYAFEQDVPETGLPDYGTAVWWTAMLLTSLGSDYFPRTPEGRVLCFLLALYGFAVFGYVTATLATFFIGRDAEDPAAEIASGRALAELQAEIQALRTEIQVLLPPQQADQD